MLAPEERLRRLVDELIATNDSLRALESLVEIGLVLEGVTRERAASGLAAGRSFGDVARALGISRQAAHRRFRDVGPTARPTEAPRLVTSEPWQLGASEPAMHALRLARDEAVRNDAIAIGSEHLLVGVLRAGGPVARVLHRHGVELDTAAAIVGSVPEGAGRAPDRGGLSGGMRRVLADAARVALRRGGRCVEVNDVLLAALADADGGARFVLSTLGASVASIRSELGCARRAA